MRIFYLAPRSPFPADFGGCMRVAAILAGLEKLGDVRLVVLGDDPGSQGRDQLLERGATLLPARAESSLERARRIGRSVLTGRSIPAARFLWPERAREILLEIERHRSDVVILGETFLAELAPMVRSAGFRVVIDTFNVESELWRSVASVARTPLERAGYSLLALNTAALERKTLRIADRVWAASEEDAAWYRSRLSLATVDVVPNVMPARSALAPAEGEGEAAEEPALLFTGHYGYPPNEDAALRLLDISRALEAKGRPHRLYLVGRAPSRRLLAAASTMAQVTVTGRVDSVEPWLARSTVFVAPLAAGSGTKFKLIEALLAERPVVTTAVGASGLALRDGVDAFVRREEEMVETVAALLGDETLRRRVAAQGRRHALARFTTAALDAALAAALGPLLPSDAGEAEWPPPPRTLRLVQKGKTAGITSIATAASTKSKGTPMRTKSPKR